MGFTSIILLITLPFVSAKCTPRTHRHIYIYTYYLLRICFITYLTPVTTPELFDYKVFVIIQPQRENDVSEGKRSRWPRVSAPFYKYVHKISITMAQGFTLFNIREIFRASLFVGSLSVQRGDVFPKYFLVPPDGSRWIL